MNSLLVDVAKRPMAALSLAKELASALPGLGSELLPLSPFFFAARLPSTPPRTAARITATAIATGRPILSHLLRFLGAEPLFMKGDVSLAPFSPPYGE